MRRVSLVAVFLVVLGGVYLQVRGNSREPRANFAPSSPPTPTLAKARAKESTLLPADRGSQSGKPSGSPVLLSQITTPPRKHHRVVLYWTPSQTSLTGGDVIGYNVYRSSGLSTEFARLNVDPVLVPEYIDDQVRSGSVYYYTTTAVNEAGKQSRHSNLVRVVIPFP
jgi:hypothetical protein